MSNHHYSKKFAGNTVQAFLKKYSRATEILARILNVRYYTFINILGSYIQHDQFKWEASKKLIKLINSSEDHGLTRKLALNYLTYDRRNALSEYLYEQNKEALTKVVLDLDRIFGVSLISDEVIRAD